MMVMPVGVLDGLSNAERENRIYSRYSDASDAAGHVSVRGLPRLFFRRRNLQIFTSRTDAATVSVLLIDPKLVSGTPRPRFGPGRWARSRRRALPAGDDSGGSTGAASRQ
jgi:hypothetical protein